jgi:superkiller protein 3
MKRMLFVACALAAVNGVSPPMVLAENGDQQGQQFQQADEDVKRGEKAAAKNDWMTARDAFIAANQSDPKSVVALYDLGVAKAHLGDLEAAADAERAAIAIDQSYAPAYVELGWILTRTGDYKAAANAEQRAIQLEPGNKTAQRNLDSIQRMMIRTHPEPLLSPMPAKKTVGRGILTLEDAGRLSPAQLIGNARDNYGQHQQLLNFLVSGQQAFQRGEIPLARQHFEQAVLLAADSSAAHTGLGVVLGTEGNIDAELVEELRAVTIDPKNAVAYSNIGWVEAKKQHWSDAQRNYERALAADPSLIPARVGKALVLYHTGHRNEGVDFLTAVVHDEPNDAQAKVALGTLLLQEGQAEQAATQLSSALTLKPGDVVAKQQLALALLASGKAAQSAAVFRDLTAALDDGADAHAGLSLALEMQGDTAGAEQEARRALGINPRLQIAQATLERLEKRKSASTETTKPQ